MSDLIKISDSTNTESSVIAASAKAVKDAYDLANSKADLDSSGKVPISQLPIGTTSFTAAAGDHIHPIATTSTNGFMGAGDKTKLNGITTGATKNTITLKTWSMDDFNGGSGGTISFTINCYNFDNKTFTADAGMTWEEWCDSEYNTQYIYISGNSVMFFAGSTYTINNATPTAAIIAGYTYSVS